MHNTNRMRNLHAIIRTEFRKENVTILRKLEQLEKKMPISEITEGLPIDV